jgi:hypothetical protein
MSAISRFLSFNFYTNDLLFCDKLYSNSKDTVEEKGFLFKRKACKNPLFYNDLKIQIEEKNPELIVITTHGTNKDSYLNEFLENKLYNLPQKYVLLAQQQFKQLNIVVFVKQVYLDYYEYIGYDQDMVANITQTVAVYIKSDYGELAFIALNRPEEYAQNINHQMVNVQVKNLLDRYITKNVNFYFIITHIAGYYDHNNMVSEINDYYVENGILNKNTEYLIEKSELTVVETQSTHDGLFTVFDIYKQNKKILCFTWNTDKTPLCNEDYLGPMDEHERKKFLSTDKCFNPLFFRNIEEQIISHNPFIVAISCEGDLEKGTFFHYEFLPKKMKNLNYFLLENDKVNNIGDAGQNESMRLSIYLRNDIMDVGLVHINKSLLSYNETAECNKSHFLRHDKKQKSMISKTKAIAKYVMTNAGVIAFTSIQIPDGTSPENANTCIKKIKNDLLKSGKISYVFLMGDFSYPNTYDDNNEFIYDADFNEDPLAVKYNFKYNSLSYYEEGSYIIPNYKLKSIGISQRQNYNINEDKYENDINGNNGKITWHDRIYYKTNDLTSYTIKCNDYLTVMGFPMLHGNSHHLGVLGVYELEKNDSNNI